MWVEAEQASGASAVHTGGDDASVVEEVRAGVGAVAGDVGVEVRSELQVGAQERLKAGVHAEVAGGVGAEQTDQGLGDDPAGAGTELHSVLDRLGFGEDVVTPRGAGGG